MLGGGQAVGGGGAFGGRCAGVKPSVLQLCTRGSWDAVVLQLFRVVILSGWTVRVEFSPLSDGDNNVSLPGLLEGLSKITAAEGPECKHNPTVVHCIASAWHIVGVQQSPNECQDYYFPAELKGLRVLSGVEIKPKCMFLKFIKCILTFVL